MAKSSTFTGSCFCAEVEFTQIGEPELHLERTSSLPAYVLGDVVGGDYVWKRQESSPESPSSSKELKKTHLDDAASAEPGPPVGGKMDGGADCGKESNYDKHHRMLRDRCLTNRRFAPHRSLLPGLYVARVAPKLFCQHPPTRRDTPVIGPALRIEGPRSYPPRHDGFAAGCAGRRDGTAPRTRPRSASQ